MKFYQKLFLSILIISLLILACSKIQVGEEGRWYTGRLLKIMVTGSCFHNSNRDLEVFWVLINKANDDVVIFDSFYITNKSGVTYLGYSADMERFEQRNGRIRYFDRAFKWIYQGQTCEFRTLFRKLPKNINIANLEFVYGLHDKHQIRIKLKPQRIY